MNLDFFELLGQIYVILYRFMYPNHVNTKEAHFDVPKYLRMLSSNQDKNYIASKTAMTNRTLTV